MDTPLLLTDLDNTLYNWVDFFAPSFRSMVHVINKETGFSEEEIISSFRSVYKEYDAIEYSLSVQSLELLGKLPVEKINELSNLARKVYVRTGRKYLIPYIGVKETLNWAKSSGICIICVTNSPVHLALWKLRQMKLTSYFYGLVARKTGDGKKRKKSLTRIKKLWELDIEELKPNPTAYTRVIDHLSVDPKNVFVVGDNFERDIKPALQIGAVGIWAKYGEISEQKNKDTIKKITTFDKKTNGSGSETVIENTLKLQINEFSELRSMLPELQMSLPGFNKL